MAAGSTRFVQVVHKRAAMHDDDLFHDDDGGRVPMVHALTADDGWVLRVFEHGPSDPAREGEAHGVVLLGHAMMVDARTLERGDRPTITSALCEAGYRVLVCDLRGHGHSGPRAADGGDWDYDRLVDDMPALVDLAAQVAGDKPVIVMGHSLFGHVALAHLGQRPAGPVRAVVLLACQAWLRSDEPSPWRRLVKSVLVRLSRVLVRRNGYLPVRRLRMGTNDESSGFWNDLARSVLAGTWRSEDGSVDYKKNLARIDLPVLHVLSRGDRLYAHPSSARRFTASLPNRTLWILGRQAPPQLAEVVPSHMGVVTDPHSQPLWRAVAQWLNERLGVHE